MNATILNCTLKPSPAEANTEALARVVIDALEAPRSLARPGRTGARAPAPGDSYLASEDAEGKAWSKTTGETAAQNLVAVATALAAQPVPPPPSG